MKPGSATLPFFGIQPCVVDEKGNEIFGNGIEGRLCMKASWPGQARTVYGDHKRFVETYFSQYPGLYFTGDGCRRDEDGYYWITGRVDDVLNVSGHRLGTAEVESAIYGHPAIAEVAVIGIPDEKWGESVLALVVTTAGSQLTEDDVIAHTRTRLAGYKCPKRVEFRTELARTATGKLQKFKLREPYWQGRDRQVN
jgi:acetyl-CoA synthetase